MGIKRGDKKLHIARRGVLYSLVLCCLILLIGGVGFWVIDPGVHTLADGLRVIGVRLQLNPMRIHPL